jgi:hypothetical protein
MSLALASERLAALHQHAELLVARAWDQERQLEASRRRGRGGLEVAEVPVRPDRLPVDDVHICSLHNATTRGASRLPPPRRGH